MVSLEECQRKVKMVSSELKKIDDAAVARSEEIHQLSTFLSPYQQPRAFRKELPRALLQMALAVDDEVEEPERRPPFHHLRDELALLLGVSGSNLVVKTWEQHGLELHETSADRLRPALLKLFSTAARIAAPRGSSLGLKAVVRAFESDYFPISPAGKAMPTAQDRDQRFTLLALIQNGQGLSLLPAPKLANGVSANGAPHEGTSHLGSAPPSPLAEPDFSARDEAERLRVRREFLFESCCRAKSWTEAYRHSRLLSLGEPQTRLSASVQRRLPEVYRMNLGAKTPPAKKNSFWGT
jgi:hypothetical protein